MDTTYDSAPIGGLCTGMPIEIWFPVVKKGGANKEERAERTRLDSVAVETCSMCKNCTALSTHFATNRLVSGEE
jgi:hypothetical protein